MTKTQNKFGISNFGHCYLFDICDLEFLVTSADCRKGERPLKPPQGAAQSRVLWARILYWGINVVFFLWSGP
jgi:hypothetical protein